ncbi:hypothetical protein THRCLA_05281 [Thraustotheca clavata]|uniref:MYND-type domain-containing protein n=1 Tax=Thraustotheca clavata TaxID=74557 RepID=A0A1V9ZWE9_9STRA|nr:hypothetical protein THRCLA_05281 [Thraustotheca clavata]
METLECSECHMRLEKRRSFRETQWENPRPMCNACASSRAWKMFAADMAACPNAHVIHNHQEPERREAVESVMEQKETPLTQWEKDAAKKLRGELAEEKDDGVWKWKSYPEWCSGCEKPVRKALRCSQCRKVYFCSTSCQKSAWNKHKIDCCQKKKNSNTSDWNDTMNEIRSNDYVVCWKALTRLQTQLSDGVALKISVVENFVANNGVECFLELLKKMDESQEHHETIWQILLLLTRFTEASPSLVFILRAHGTVAILINLLATNSDFRIRASAVATLGTMLAASRDIAKTYSDLDILPSILALFCDEDYGAGRLSNDIELVTCLQATAILLQLIEASEYGNVIEEICSFRMTIDGQTITAADMFVHLLHKRRIIYSVSAETGMPVGHHLYLNILNLVGLLVHGDSKSHELFVAADFFPLWIDHVSMVLRDNGQLITSYKWHQICQWLADLMSKQFIRSNSSEMELKTQSMEVFDRLIGHVTPFLRNSQWYQSLPNLVPLSAKVFAFAVSIYVESNDNTSYRVCLTSLDLFLCSSLPPFEMDDKKREDHIHNYVEIIWTTLDNVLQQCLAAVASKKALEPLYLLAAETIKCVGLISHYGQCMPIPPNTFIPQTIAALFVYPDTPLDTQRVGMAAIASSGNAVHFTLDECKAIQGMLSTKFTSNKDDEAFQSVLDAFMEIINKNEDIAVLDSSHPTAMDV